MANPFWFRSFPLFLGFCLLLTLFWSSFHRIGRGVSEASWYTVLGSTSGIGIVQPLSFPLVARPGLKRKRPDPEHSIPFFWHLKQVGSPLSQTIRRFEH